MDIRTPIPTNGGDWLAKFGDLWKKQVTQLQEHFGGKLEEVKMPPEAATDVPVLYVKKDAIVEVAQYLKDEAGMDYQFLSDITATDEQVEPRFEVIYQLFSVSQKSRIRVKVRVSEGDEVPTLTSVWPAANWAEREVFDMFGIRFKGHPDLRRILMDSRWQGHPLRKDYPLRGYQLFTDPQPVDPNLLK